VFRVEIGVGDGSEKTEVGRENYRGCASRVGVVELRRELRGGECGGGVNNLVAHVCSDAFCPAIVV